MPLDAGTQLGPYAILSPIGVRGMGEVYKARDTRLDRTVAIEVLPEHAARLANPAPADTTPVSVAWSLSSSMAPAPGGAQPVGSYDVHCGTPPPGPPPLYTKIQQAIDAIGFAPLGAAGRPTTSTSSASAWSTCPSGAWLIRVRK